MVGGKGLTRVTLVDLRALTRTLATWLAAITTLVFAFSRFLPSGHSGSAVFRGSCWCFMWDTLEAQFHIEMLDRLSNAALFVLRRDD
jgi:hypothetical protein